MIAAIQNMHTCNIALHVPADVQVKGNDGLKDISQNPPWYHSKSQPRIYPSTNPQITHRSMPSLQLACKALLGIGAESVGPMDHTAAVRSEVAGPLRGSPRALFCFLFLLLFASVGKGDSKRTCSTMLGKLLRGIVGEHAKVTPIMK